VRVDYERGKLQAKVTELQNERDLIKGELEEIKVKHSSMLS
jgi:hypothetical protein